MVNGFSLAKKLELVYGNILVNLGIPQHLAKKGAKQIIREAKEYSRTSGTKNLNYEWCKKVRNGEVKNEGWQKYFDIAGKEGVEESDFRWWWDLDDLERLALLRMDDYIHFSSYIGHRNNGMSEKEAASEVRKTHPYYGLPQADEIVQNEDVPLPWELRDRINIYIEHMAINHPEEYKKKFHSFETFNAHIRSVIREGGLNRRDYE